MTDSHAQVCDRLVELRADLADAYSYLRDQRLFGPANAIDSLLARIGDERLKADFVAEDAVSAGESPPPTAS